MLPESARRLYGIVKKIEKEKVMKRISYVMVFVMLMLLILPMKSSAKNIDLNNGSDSF